MNSIYYDENNNDVKLIPVVSKKDFQEAWNSMSDPIDHIYIYVHGGEGKLWLNGEEMTIKEIKKLDSKKVNINVNVFSCNAGKGKEETNVAWAFAKITMAKVVACSGKLSFSYDKIAKKYNARKSFKDFGVFKTFWYDKENDNLIAQHKIGGITH